MKLGMVILKPDLAIKEIAFRQMTEEKFDLSLDGGIVTIRHKDRPDEAPFLVPFGNVHFARPAVASPKAKAA